MKKTGLINISLAASTQVNMLVGISSQPVERIIDKINFAFHVLDNTDVNDRVLSVALVILEDDIENSDSVSYSIYDPNLMAAGLLSNCNILFQHHISVSGADCGAHVELELAHRIPSGQKRTILLTWVGKYKITTTTGSINPTGVRNLNVSGRELVSNEQRMKVR